MKLPEPSKIVKTSYEGPTDEQGLAHGYGKMSYDASNQQFRYEGLFVHGKRQGFGVLCVALWRKNPVDAYSWYSQGVYDSVGRLVEPYHAQGTYQEYIHDWVLVRKGWWSDDELICDLTDVKPGYADFEITPTDEFLAHFIDRRDVKQFSKTMVSRLRESTDAYGRYGYGQWLYHTCKDKESLKEATECFKFAVESGIVDAKQMLSSMYLRGCVYSEESDDFVIDHALCHALNTEAVEQGSLLAKICRNYDLFYGRTHLKADRATAIAEAERESSVAGASLLWLEQLGWYYEDENRLEDAIDAYERCIKGGLYSAIYYLAFTALNLGNTEYYQALMREGIRLGVSSCLVFGVEKDDTWDSLDADEKSMIHRRLECNLKRGVELSNDFCPYLLSYSYIYGAYGFERDVAEGFKVLQKGLNFHGTICWQFLAEIIIEDEIMSALPEDMQMSEDEIMILKLKALRYGAKDVLDDVVADKEAYVRMGYGSELQNIWLPKWREIYGIKEYKTPVKPIEKKPIAPTVLVIRPSGVVDFVEADVYPMSFRQMAELIAAERVDAVHFSEPLTQITKACGLKQQVAMYVDRDGAVKDLDDNPVATILYGKRCEIRGSVIVAMEDNRYGTYSFDTEEDINAVFEAVSKATNGLARRKN